MLLLGVLTLMVSIWLTGCSRSEPEANGGFPPQLTADRDHLQRVTLHITGMT